MITVPTVRFACVVQWGNLRSRLSCGSAGEHVDDFPGNHQHPGHGVHSSAMVEMSALESFGDNAAVHTRLNASR